MQVASTSGRLLQRLERLERPRVSLVSDVALPDEPALRLGNGQAILIANNSVPQGSDVANLLVRCEVMSASRIALVKIGLNSTFG